MRVSRVISLAMLFLAGISRGRFAGHTRPSRTGFAMALLGAALIAVVMALGGCTQPCRHGRSGFIRRLPVTWVMAVRGPASW